MIEDFKNDKTPIQAAKIMPADRAEKLDHIKQLRFNVQLKNLRKRINRRIT